MCERRSDHLMKLVTAAFEWAYAEAEKDVSPKHLAAAAELLKVRRDTIRVIDAPLAREHRTVQQNEPKEK